MKPPLQAEGLSFHGEALTRQIRDEGLTRLFDPELYLYFNEDFVSPERTEREVAFLLSRVVESPTDRILDLGCGDGRHALRISDNVSHVVGIDRSEAFLSIARANANRRGCRNVEFRCDDMLELNQVAEFDRALLMSTIVGLHEDQETMTLFHRVNRSLRTNGTVCFNVVNRDTALVNFQPEGIVERGNDYVLDRLAFDCKTGRMHSDRVYIKNGHAVRAPFSLRMFNQTEISLMLSHAGFDVTGLYADWVATPFSSQSRAMIVIAKKRANEESA